PEIGCKLPIRHQLHEGSLAHLLADRDLVADGLIELLDQFRQRDGIDGISQATKPLCNDSLTGSVSRWLDRRRSPRRLGSRRIIAHWRRRHLLRRRLLRRQQRSEYADPA